MTILEIAVMKRLSDGPQSTARLFVVLGLRTRQSKRVLGVVLKRLRDGGHIALFARPVTGGFMWERLDAMSAPRTGTSG